MNGYKTIEQILDNYLNQLPKKDTAWPPKVYRATSFIHTNLFDPKLNVSWMKEQCCIKHKNHSTKFFICIGLKPKQYILYHRIEASKPLLRQTAATVTTVSISLGFNSLSAFDKIFKDRMELRPTVWRKHVRNGK